jgi:hypothetical protein
MYRFGRLAGRRETYLDFGVDYRLAENTHLVYTEFGVRMGREKGGE